MWGTREAEVEDEGREKQVLSELKYNQIPVFNRSRPRRVQSPVTFIAFQEQLVSESGRATFLLGQPELPMKTSVCISVRPSHSRAILILTRLLAACCTLNSIPPLQALAPQEDCLFLGKNPVLMSRNFRAALWELACNFGSFPALHRTCGSLSVIQLAAVDLPWLISMSQ